MVEQKRREPDYAPDIICITGKRIRPPYHASSAFSPSAGITLKALTVAPTDDPTLSRMTIQTVGDEKAIEQIEKQLHKLVDVLRVSELGQNSHVEREIMLVKVQASGFGP
ncbi:Acetolactate synthase isozyme 3 small subunit [Raoultella planticola]|uniref:Acetolactate synthase small subunit n=1 Tax=Raoultella planticola TaxID=575 RepID=A0A485B1Q0_RAOPL|nr:Acetolactate synthase isozyme 3 small subunit [Raoultella planticola]